MAVAEGKADCGIFVDGVGYGSAMIANKIYGIYAAVYLCLHWWENNWFINSNGNR